MTPPSPSPLRWRRRLACAACVGLAGFWPTAGDAAPLTTNALSAPASSTERLLSRLPDPSQFEKSPLESAVEDRAESTPEFRRIVTDLRAHNNAAALGDARALANRYPDSHPAVHRLHGVLALMSKQYTEADKAFRLQIALQPKRGLGWLSLAHSQRLQGHYQEALGSLRTGLALEPTATYGWLLLADCQYHLRHLPEAMDAAHRATQVNPRLASAWYCLGRLELVPRKFDQAGADFRRAAELLPGSLPIQGAEAFCFIEGGKPADAIPPLERVVQKAPNDVVAATKLAYCYLATGRPERGVEVCRRAVRVQPRYAAAWDMLGQCCHRAGNDRDAADAYQHALNLAPGDLNVRTRLDELRQSVARR